LPHQVEQRVLGPPHYYENAPDGGHVGAHDCDLLDSAVDSVAATELADVDRFLLQRDLVHIRDGGCLLVGLQVEEGFQHHVHSNQYF
jgi:hypothetical protein